MKDSNVVDFAVARLARERRLAEGEYASKIAAMDKTELLCELLKYDELVKTRPHDVQAVIRAQMLMAALEERAELKHVRALATEYRRKLATKVYERIQNISAKKPN